jgi:alpha-L-fucosidase
VAWQRLGLTAFFHFGMNTFTGDEVGDGNASPDTFNPGALDTAQWVSTMKAAGFKQGILVAKHHDGFCLWPTKCSDYSVAKSAWRDGKGDVVKDFTDAAHKADFRVGLYLSPLDNHAADSSGAADYGDKFRCWVDELLTSYGRVDEIWFDGNGAPASVGRDLYEHIKTLQPHIVIFTGPEIAAPGADIRWVGNEGGNAPAGETSVQEMGNDTIWFPSESDTSIRPGWFYHPEDDGAVKSLAQLTDIFFNSVGRNSVLLLNVPPNRAAGKDATGDSTFHEDYGAARAVDGNPDTFWAAGHGTTTGRLEVDLGAATSVRIVDLSEPIALGERSKKYHVEVQAPGTTTWTTIASGTVIGQRNLLRVNPPRMAQKIAVVIEDARGVPAIAELGVY